jgi:hypothetical protein
MDITSALDDLAKKKASFKASPSPSFTLLFHAGTPTPQTLAALTDALALTVDLQI